MTTSIPRAVLRRMGAAEWVGLGTLAALLLAAAWLTHVMFGNRAVGGDIRRDVAEVHADVHAARQDVHEVRRQVQELVEQKTADRYTGTQATRDLTEIRDRLGTVEGRLSRVEATAGAATRP